MRTFSTNWYRLSDSGDPVECDSMDEYHAWEKTAGGRKAFRVADDFVNGIRVSTVFLGLDHSHDYGPPVLWESMTFGGDSWWGDQLCERYTSREDAVRGHAAMVEKVRVVPPPPPDAVLRRLYETERVLQTVWSAMTAIKWTAERGEPVTPDRVTHYEEYVRKFRASKIEATKKEPPHAP